MAAPGGGAVARCRRVGGSRSVGRRQGHIEQRALPLIDELLDLPGKDIEPGAIRRIDDLQLLRAQHQKLRRRLVPRRFCQPQGAFAEIGRAAPDLNRQKMRFAR